MLLTSKTLTVSIACRPEQVFAFASLPQNLPRWASAFIQTIEETSAGWLAQTNLGQVGIAFRPVNDWGILDHVVTLPSGQEVVVPMRVIANGEGSEVLFTLFQFPGMPAEKFQEDISLVQQDLQMLKRVLEDDAAVIS